MKRKNAAKTRWMIPLLAAFLVSSCNQGTMKKNIYVAWSNKQDSYSFISTIKTIEAIGCKPVVLDMVKSTDVPYDASNALVDAVDEHGILLPRYAEEVKKNNWKHSNVTEIAKDIDCIIFPGGSDICPSLYKEAGTWHGIEADTDYAAVRDISDYALMSYCLEKNIAILAICRGMQMLSVVSGATMIADIPTYFHSQGADDNETHRDKEKQVFASHDVDVTDTSSLLYKTSKKTKLTKVPSWHHQGVLSLEGTGLVATGENVTNGIKMIEAVERKDLSFCLGVQFHPEVAVRKHVLHEEDADQYMTYEDATCFFESLSASRLYKS